MLKTVKQNLLKATKSLGLFNFLANTDWRKNKLLILAYHGIALEDEHLWNSSLYVDADFLRRRFEILKKSGYNVLPLGEAVEKLYAGNLPEKSVAITFDDGNYDFYKRALPIIKEFSFPVTVYLTTYYSEFNRPVFGVTANYLLWKAKSKKLALDKLTGENLTLNLSNENERLQAHSSIVAHAERNKFSAEEKDDLLAKLSVELKINYAEFCQKRILQVMNADEAEQVAAAGIDIQLHTHRHRVPLDEKLFRREIVDNRQIINGLTGRKNQAETVHFCYPSGEHHEKFFPWMKSENIVSATTCETALADKTTDPLLLPRLVDTCPLSDIEFEGWLSGVSQFLPQRRNAS
jgi:peptidoglycan/xylan/chitin deacetylase (PgdA/CDA1 family)